MTELKCPECATEIYPPMYTPGIAYQGSIWCSGCNTPYRIKIDREGNFVEYLKVEAPPGGTAGEMRITPEEFQQMMSNPEEFARKVFDRMKADQAQGDQAEPENQA
jgi:hypothetical protein